MSLFSNVPVEDDTTILSQRNIKIDNLDVLHQKWFWDGVKAESLIFIASDVDTLNDSALESFARQSSLPSTDSSFTLAMSPLSVEFLNIPIFQLLSNTIKYRPKSGTSSAHKNLLFFPQLMVT